MRTQDDSHDSPELCSLKAYSELSKASEGEVAASCPFQRSWNSFYAQPTDSWITVAFVYAMQKLCLEVVLLVAQNAAVIGFICVLSGTGFLVELARPLEVDSALFKDAMDAREELYKLMKNCKCCYGGSSEEPHCSKR